MLLNPACWANYASAMHDHSEIYRAGDDVHPPLQHFPSTIEGIPTDILGFYVPIPYADFSAHAFLRWIGLAPFSDFWPLLIVGVIFIIWLWRSRELRIEALLAGIAVWFFVIDLFLPAYRNSYNDVLILNVVALGLMTATKVSRGIWPCLLALVLGLGIYITAPTQAWLINLPTLLFTIGAALFLFSPKNLQMAKDGEDR